MKPEIKKQIILHLPYLAFIYLFGKVGQAFRLAQGADLSGKLLHIGQGFSAAFASAAPSFHPTDLLIGLAAAVIIRLVVYSKQKNAKKYRKGMEYGTARWGTAADIKPFIDPVFDNNVLLTQTERLMMSNRPKDPKNARNKNILVIGGSGSGKTRFFCKPNMMKSAYFRQVKSQAAATGFTTMLIWRFYSKFCFSGSLTFRWRKSGESCRIQLMKKRLLCKIRKHFWCKSGTDWTG